MADAPAAPTATSWEPRAPGLWAVVATGVFVAILCAPMATGQLLVGPHSDQFIAGYGFRQFWTEYVRAYGAIPLWNPYIFGGLPYVGAMHGDLLYPFTWVRLLVATDTAMNLAFFVHLWLAGALTYLFLRSLALPWAAALFGGVAYQLSGIVASLVHPGHDGKLYVSALLPFVLWALVRWIRDGRLTAAAALGAGVGLAILSPSFQMAYYLLIAAGLFALYLALWDPERPPVRAAWLRLATAAAMMVLGLGVAAVQVLPFLDYLPFSPRSVPGASSGWEYATSYSMPPAELLATVLPQLFGVAEAYHGSNPIKLHSEYLGIVALIVATVGLLATERRRLRWALVGLGALFLLISLGGHTPFYRLVYEVLPMMKKVRAPSMAFFVTAFTLAVAGALGVERLWRAPRERPPGLFPWLGAIALIVLLAVAGVFTNVARAAADPGQVALAAANQGPLVLGAVRIALFAAITAGLLLVWRAGKLPAPALALGLPLIAGLDLWSVERRFFVYSPPATALFGDDDVTRRIKAAPGPLRVLDVGGYGGAILMGYDIPQVLGYHGNEIRYYDDLLGGKNLWRHLPSRQLWSLLGVRFIVARDTLAIPGFHHVVGPVTTAQGHTAHLYEADTIPPYARVATAAAKVQEDAIIPTILDPRLPGFERVVLLDPSQPVNPLPVLEMPEPSPSRASVTAWRPGAMTIALDPGPPAPSYVLVAENWYHDWQATVDGQPATPVRGNGSLLVVPVQAGARHVELSVRSVPYERGRAVSLASALVLLAIAVAPLARRLRRG
jgi:hypothetical protein